ncbi:MAG TPA: hypothetical protein VL095_03790, partial [Flavisolibacter sp.]|nr:hypothetical protein [Flavisolibacter sp.]
YVIFLELPKMPNLIGASSVHPTKSWFYDQGFFILGVSPATFQIMNNARLLTPSNYGDKNYRTRNEMRRNERFIAVMQFGS